MRNLCCLIYLYSLVIETMLSSVFAGVSVTVWKVLEHCVFFMVILFIWLVCCYFMRISAWIHLVIQIWFACFLWKASLFGLDNLFDSNFLELCFDFSRLFGYQYFFSFGLGFCRNDHLLDSIFRNQKILLIPTSCQNFLVDLTLLIDFLFHLAFRKFKFSQLLSFFLVHLY